MFCRVHFARRTSKTPRCGATQERSASPFRTRRASLVPRHFVTCLREQCRNDAVVCRARESPEVRAKRQHGRRRRAASRAAQSRDAATSVRQCRLSPRGYLPSQTTLHSWQPPQWGADHYSSSFSSPRGRHYGKAHTRRQYESGPTVLRRHRDALTNSAIVDPGRCSDHGSRHRSA